MAGRFDGLTDMQWEILEPLMLQNPDKRVKGEPHTTCRNVCNTIFLIMITGSRWVDLPLGKKWASCSPSNGWLGVWQANGTLEKSS